jgi:heat shock protein
MSVVGIDFGLDTCYISVARAGGIETIANDYSMRDTPSFVGFGDQQRILGVGAKSQLLTNLKKTFFGFKPLLGRKYSDPIVREEATKLHYPISQGPDDSILVTVNYLGKQTTFTPLQITAMLFTKLREIADTALQTKVKDVVISVPVYYTDRERRALLDAATIAGLNVLKLMNDTTATALAYGIYKQDLPPPEEKARNVVFVDCGHRGIQVSACSFNKGKLAVQSCAFDQTSGGRAFTEKLVDHFVEDFQKRYRMNPREQPKALMKLRSELEKIKKQMSANTNNLPLNIECFMNDKDVSGHVNRETFEELIAPELERVEAVLRQCLETSKWKPDDVYSVEIVGGSTRVPAIKNLIEKVFGKTPNTTLNADEAVSRGCALQCAILSPTFKVREFSVTDVQPFPISLRWSAESDSGDMVVFPQFHAVPFSKMLTFYRRDVFSVEGEYDNTAPIAERHIGTFEIGEVKPQADGSNQKVKVKVRMTRSQSNSVEYVSVFWAVTFHVRTVRRKFL